MQEELTNPPRTNIIGSKIAPALYVAGIYRTRLLYGEVPGVDKADGIRTILYG